MTYVGSRVRRIEDERLISGKGQYIDDIELPGTLYLAILRSQVAHAKLRRVDLSDVLKIQGVVDAFSGLNIKVENRPRNFPMASDEILYEGQPIAAVVATDRYLAYDALESVQLEYEELPAVTDPVSAIEEKISAVENQKNLVYSRTYSSGNAEEAIEKSDKVVELDLEISRVYPAAMETRGLLVVYSPNSLTVYAPTQSPHFMRRYLLQAFSDQIQDIRVVQPDVGGAFGSKLFPYPEDYITVHASLRLRRPIKWISTRSEDMRSTYHARGQVHKVKAGAKKDGTLMGIMDDLFIDLGAASHGTYLADIAATMLPGPYSVRDVKVMVYGVYTNKTPLDQYRGAGRPEASFVIERIMDSLADELGMDPVELRKKNLIREVPYKNPFGLLYDSGNYLSLLERAEKVYREMVAKAEELRSAGRQVGVGFDFYLEQNNFGPWESASVRVRGDGKVTVIIGAAPHGQGTATGVAQIVAEELGVDMRDVEVRWGDTSMIGEGYGTYGSRSLTLAGNAALLASRKVKEKALKLASQFLRSDVQELRYEQGKVTNLKTGKFMTLKEIASKSMSSLGGIWRYREEPGLEGTAYFGLDNYTYPYGSHVVMVEIVDGKPRVLDYYAIDDIGLVVNPLLAEGQVRGGIIQGFGETILEEVSYTQFGNLLTGNFSDYAIPTAVEAFSMRWDYLEEGKSNAPLPAKGIGEGATIGTPPALIRAAEKAVSKKLHRLPIRPESLLP
ncbi:xanthine dehydrogenase family protein molybdopterin-binding subunit [Metallosphaera tengchongensis]|uniref:Xanthine dehydrogenase family protein molybdopterin-binding subunit n=1 Tax=Metallosphaera tengchongensis TaxID=1532350 RepID=A0A6N0NUI1_9CREN|nr:glyceraldehyde dehydrogenase subunit alpha [Metallosphaera tengchongensis]QKR00382.1 xanthine dehydrogenase family protein molybdopterin-binding subunit [Metallosphaera tengchongensis]